jgi:hypothetical protein
MVEDDTVVGEVRFNQPEAEMYFDFPGYVAFLNAGPATGKHALGLLTSIRRHWMDAAREAIKDNSVPSSAGRRFWELSGSICYCGGCGNRMMSYTTRAGRARKLYHYYRCRTRQQHGKDACAQKTNYHAHEVEGPVWEFVSGYLMDPNQLRSDLERMIEREREGLRGNPAQEAKLWLRKLAEVDQKRGGFQDMAAEGPHRLR